MAHAEPMDEGQESDGSWAGDPLEDREQGQLLNQELARRAAVLEQRMANGNWCTCGECFPVHSAESAFDVTCCQESDQARQLCQENVEFEDPRPYRCVTHHPVFYGTCLYERRLANDAHHYHMEGVDPRHVDRNTRLRYIAYRAYTTWAHGYLGRQHRRVIPLCVMARIRRRFSAEQYRGFQPPQREAQQ